MEKVILSFLGASIFLMSCQNITNKEVLGEDSIRIAESKLDNFAGRVPVDMGVFDMGMQPDKYSLSDVDDYYKNELPLHKEYSYYHNLRELTIATLMDYNILEDGSDEMVAYYIKEQVDMKSNLLNADNFSLYLKRMENIWTQEELLDHAEKFLAKNNKVLVEYKDSEYIERKSKELGIVEKYIKEI